MNSIIAFTLLSFLPAVSQVEEPREKTKIKRSTVAAILETIPKEMLPPRLLWSAEQLMEVNSFLKKNSPGFKMVILMKFASTEAEEKYIRVGGPIMLLEYTKLDFRGNPDLLLRPFIRVQSHLAFPLSSREMLQKARKGDLLKLEATTALITLDGATADVFFDPGLGKTTLLEIVPAK